MIESYSFGRMVVDRKTYTSDLIIFPDRIDSSWWRKEGHKLCIKDIESVLSEKPEVLIIGTGFMGLMKADEAVRQNIPEKGISLIIEKTSKAVQIFNDLSIRRRTIGAFHLTC